MTKKDLNRQIGWLVGQLIISNDLPTLSTDSLKTNRVIEVSEELARQWEEMEDKRSTYYNKPELKEEYRKYFYETLHWYKENIEKKYLPSQLRVHMYFEFTDKKIVMSAIEDSLWDCDLSHYKLSDIEEGPVVVLEYHEFDFTGKL